MPVIYRYTHRVTEYRHEVVARRSFGSHFRHVLELKDYHQTWWIKSRKHGLFAYLLCSRGRLDGKEVLPEGLNLETCLFSPVSCCSKQDPASSFFVSLTIRLDCTLLPIASQIESRLSGCCLLLGPPGWLGWPLLHGGISVQGVADEIS